MGYQTTKIKGRLSAITENMPLVTGAHRYVVIEPKKPQAVQLQIEQEQGVVYQMFYGEAPSLYLGKEVVFVEESFLRVLTS